MDWFDRKTCEISRIGLQLADDSKQVTLSTTGNMTQPTTESLDLSVIIPTLNEADNLALLVPRLHAALSPRRYELIIVDDNSQDNTPAVCAELAQSYQLRLIVRRQPKDGLSGAVMEGIAAARGEVLLVMDADLQHRRKKPRSWSR